MSAPRPPGLGAPVSIVLADANVLYSRVLRDYLLYASAERLISVRWSQEILDEMAKHLIKNIATFDDDSAQVLLGAMGDYFPYALVEPGPEHYKPFGDLHMLDADDRHVVAAAIAAEANVLCTSNVKDFPDEVMERVGIQRVTPDMLLTSLASSYPDKMRQIHQTSVKSLEGATDASTLAALERAGAPQASAAMTEVLSLVIVRTHVRAGRVVRTHFRRR